MYSMTFFPSIGMIGGPGIMSGANYGPRYAIFEAATRNTGTKLFEDRRAGSHRATLSANRTYVPIAFGVVLCAGGLSLLGLPPLAAGTAAFEQMGRDELSSG